MDQHPVSRVLPKRDPGGYGKYGAEAAARLVFKQAGFGYHSPMDIDEDKIDNAVLALLWLTLHEGRAWKGFDWGTMDRLFKKGMIGDPVNKAKSVILTDEGVERSKQLFQTLFTSPP